jgi:hypothetical protein
MAVQAMPPSAAVPNQPGDNMIEVRKRMPSYLRGAMAGAEATRGEKREGPNGRIIRRIRFPTENPSLIDRHMPLSLGERLRIERWLKQ